MKFIVKNNAFHHLNIIVSTYYYIFIQVAKKILFLIVIFLINGSLVQAIGSKFIVVYAFVGPLKDFTNLAECRACLLYLS